LKRRELLSFLAAGTTLGIVANPAVAQTARTLAIAYPNGSESWIGSSVLVKAMSEQLERSGVIRPDTFRYLYRSAEGRTSSQFEFARSVVAERPDAIFVASRTLATHFKETGTQLPIVCYVADPVGTGLVASLARPGGNITGVTSDTGVRLYEKRLQLLRDMGLPARKPAFLTPNNPDGNPFVDELRVHAPALVTLQVASPISQKTIDASFEQAVALGVDALIASDSVNLLPYAASIVDAATRHRLPAIYGHLAYFEQGGLAAYAIDEADVGRLVGQTLSKIFSGSMPSTLPFLQPTKFTLAVNLLAARDIGIEVPISIVSIADLLKE
jgi:putative tryptophan/tyrosine transport system substrate-binding protein